MDSAVLNRLTLEDKRVVCEERKAALEVLDGFNDKMSHTIYAKINSVCMVKAKVTNTNQVY